MNAAQGVDWRLRALGWLPTIPLADGIRSTVAWWLQHAGAPATDAQIAAALDELLGAENRPRASRSTPVYQPTHSAGCWPRFAYRGGCPPNQ